MSTGLHQQAVLREYERELQGQRIHYPWPPAYQRVYPKTTSTKTQSPVLKNAPVKNPLAESPGLPWQKRAELKTKIRDNEQIIRERIAAVNAEIIPRTQAHNRKYAYNTLEEERLVRADVVSAQIRAWQSMLPALIKKFSQITDPRRPKSIKHSLVALMMFGLLAFVFRLSSRREMNRELTSAVFNEHFKKLFPELDSIPHADTLERLLEKINPQKIEAIQIAFIKSLIKKKKFKKLLINGCLPITIDGAQKLTRDGFLQDPRWCERSVGSDKNPIKQQYIYVIEANITLKSGLTIPIMTEYLFRDNNEFNNTDAKQDSEITAFERLADRLKKYFKRRKIIVFADAMYATQQVMGILHTNHWEFMINLPKNKLKDFAERLNRKRITKKQISGQSHYRKREQAFYWDNHITYGYEWQLTIHLVACLESYDQVNKETGEIEKHYSDHAWISSIPLHLDNLHELCNLGARKKELMEDSINTEKNRGYHYKHAYSYDWNAMQGFHYLMRLAHAVNALSEFTKRLKKYIQSLGCSATLKLIKETLFSPWFPLEWYEAQRLKSPQLRFQLE